MHFRTTIPEPGTYVYTDVTCPAGVSVSIAVAFTREIARLGDQRHIHRCLIDVQGTTSVSGVYGKYMYANRKAEEAGLKRVWRIALLKDEHDASPDFLETVMKNAGYVFQMFTDRIKAVSWLEGPATSK